MFLIIKKLFKPCLLVGLFLWLLISDFNHTLLITFTPSLMAIAQSLKMEMAYEAENTRKMLATLPEDQFDWKPGEKGMPLGMLAGHLAEIPGWAKETMLQAELDFATTDYTPYEPKTRQEILDTFNQRMEVFNEIMDKVKDEEFFVDWTMRTGEMVHFTMPRIQVMRSMLLNHFIHHRGQLSTYLRCLNVPATSLYGPTAEDKEAMGA